MSLFKFNAITSELDLVNAAGGGGTNWKTIGSGGDYSDVQAMIDDGETRGIFIGSITEDSNIVVPAGGLWLNLNGYTLTMAAFQFTMAGAYELSISGDGTDRSEIDYTQTSANQELVTGSGATLFTDGWTFDNNSSAGATYLATANVIQKLNNMVILCPNVNSTALNVGTLGSMGNNITIVGGGTANGLAVTITYGTFTNFYFNGIFKDVAGQGALAVGNRGIVHGVLSGSNGLHIICSADSILSSVLSHSTSVNIVITGDSAHISHCNLKAGTLDIGTRNDNKITSCTMGTLDMSDASADDNQISNCEIANAIVFSGDRNQIANNHFIGGVTISSGAVDNQFSNCNIEGSVSISDRTKMMGCKVGADAGGGSNTITIAAGTGTQIGLCSTDAPIVDNGIDTVLMGTIVY